MEKKILIPTDLYNALQEYKAAHQKLAELWNAHDHTGGLMADKYPHEEDFNDLGIKVNEWADHYTDQPSEAEPKFPNGFTSWAETHHEILLTIATEQEREGSAINDEYDKGGRGAMYEMGIEWANEFEKLNEGRKWDGEFFDAIEEFVNLKISQL